MNVTQNAIKNILILRKSYGDETSSLRFGLTGGGCSGYKYILEFVDETSQNDVVFNFDKFNLIVDKQHMDLLKNTTIDWKDSLMESGFDIINPQAKQPCGCGESVNF
jgi:iron-sulfur cluster assembly accessory protein